MLVVGFHPCVHIVLQVPRGATPEHLCVTPEQCSPQKTPNSIQFTNFLREHQKIWQRWLPERLRYYSFGKRVDYKCTRCNCQYGSSMLPLHDSAIGTAFNGIYHLQVGLEGLVLGWSLLVEMNLSPSATDRASVHSQPWTNLSLFIFHLSLLFLMLEIIFYFYNRKQLVLFLGAGILFSLCKLLSLRSLMMAQDHVFAQELQQEREFRHSVLQAPIIHPNHS